jgi:hypothetical protein
MKLYKSSNEQYIITFSGLCSTTLSLSTIVILHIQETGRLLNYEIEGLLVEDHDYKMQQVALD